MSHHKHPDPSKPVVIASPASSLNATQHGCCATGNLILPTETIQAFKALEAA
jgi:hypothetical protein